MIEKLKDNLRKLNSVEEMIELVDSEINKITSRLEIKGFMFNDNKEIVTGKSETLIDKDLVYRLDKLNYVKSVINGTYVTRADDVEYFDALKNDIQKIMKAKGNN